MGLLEIIGIIFVVGILSGAVITHEAEEDTAIEVCLLCASVESSVKGVSEISVPEVSDP